MISLRKQIQDSENAEGRARALAKAFLGLIAEVPKAALPAAQQWLGGFVEQMKASGFVAAALARHGIVGAAVAPLE